MEYGQHTGVAIQPVARNLAVAEESYQRHFPERAPDELQFRTARAEHVLAAREAREVKRAARVVDLRLEFPGNALQVLTRRLGVAAAEDDLHAGLGEVADGDELVLRVDADEIARGVVAGVRARHRDADEHAALGADHL